MRGYTYASRLTAPQHRPGQQRARSAVRTEGARVARVRAARTWRRTRRARHRAGTLEPCRGSPPRPGQARQQGGTRAARRGPRNRGWVPRPTVSEAQVDLSHSGSEAQVDLCHSIVPSRSPVRRGEGAGASVKRRCVCQAAVRLSSGSYITAWSFLYHRLVKKVKLRSTVIRLHFTTGWPTAIYYENFKNDVFGGGYFR